MSIEVKIPDLGENITGGRVVSIMAAKGDVIEIDQPLLELETDKAVIEMPSPASGTITEIKVNEGDDVNIGQLVCLLEEQENRQPDTREKEIEETKTGIFTSIDILCSLIIFNISSWNVPDMGHNTHP